MEDSLLPVVLACFPNLASHNHLKLSSNQEGCSVHQPASSNSNKQLLKSLLCLVATLEFPILGCPSNSKTRVQRKRPSTLDSSGIKLRLSQVKVGCLVPQMVVRRIQDLVNHKISKPLHIWARVLSQNKIYLALETRLNLVSHSCNSHNSSYKWCTNNNSQLNKKPRKKFKTYSTCIQNRWIWRVGREATRTDSGVAFTTR